MNDTGGMDILDSLENGANEASSVRFVVVAFSTYPVKKLSAGTEIEAQIKIVRGLWYSVSYRLNR